MEDLQTVEQVEWEHDKVEELQRDMSQLGICDDEDDADDHHDVGAAIARRFSRRAWWSRRCRGWR